MTKEERFKGEARETAALLGHRLGRFRRMVISAGPPAPGQRPVAVATCEICGYIVVVDPAPPPDSRAVTGEGVQRSCSAIEQEGHEMA
jgi:hypothetical protein